MSVSLDTMLSSINLDLEDLEGLSADEIEAKISDALPDGMSAEELEELKADILTELSELEDEWEELLDGEEEEYDDSETEEGKARAERNMEEIQESLELLSTFEDALDDPFEHELLLNYETSEEMTWTTTGLNSGDAVTIKCTGTQATTESMWGEDETEETEVEAGEDGVVTYADYEAAWAAEADASTAQMLFLGAAGETFTLAEEGADYTLFNVTDADGNTYTLRIEGKPAIYFEPGTVSLDAISGYSDDLAKRCYERGDTVSFYDHQNTEDVNELTYVETYNEVTSQSAFDTVWNTMNTTVSSDTASTSYLNEDYSNGVSLSKEEVQSYYTGAIDILYGYINDPTTYDSMSAAWSAVFQQWTLAGLDANAQRAIIEALVLGISQKGGQTIFQGIFASVAETLKEKIDAVEDEDYNTLDKAIALMLDSQTGITSTLWTTAFATKDADGNYVSGTWKDHEENLAALDMYQNLCDMTGWALTTGVDDAKTAENGVIAADENTKDEGTGIISDSMRETLYNEAEYYADISYGAGKTNKDAVAALKHLIDLMYNGGEEISIQDLRDKITSYISGLSDTLIDDVASIFVYMMGKECNDVLTKLTEGDAGQAWQSTMWYGYINNGDGVPHYRNYIADEVWTDYTGEWAS